MDKIIRGTTPTIEISLPTGLPASSIAVLKLTVCEHGTELFTKELADFTEISGKLRCTLTQTDSLKLCKCGGVVEVQARLKTVGGDVCASEILSVEASRILKEGAL